MAVLWRRHLAPFRDPVRIVSVVPLRVEVFLPLVLLALVHLHSLGVLVGVVEDFHGCRGFPPFGRVKASGVLSGQLVRPFVVLSVAVLDPEVHVRADESVGQFHDQAAVWERRCEVFLDDEGVSVVVGGGRSVELSGLSWVSFTKVFDHVDVRQ